MIYGFKCTDCQKIVDEDDINIQVDSDPYGTGDVWHSERRYVSPCCRADVEEISLCDACQEAETLDGYDDCAACILSGKHSHTTTYTEEDFMTASRGR